jgi:hypothetical protein
VSDLPESDDELEGELREMFEADTPLGSQTLNPEGGGQ